MKLNRWQKRFWLDALVNSGNAANIAFIFRVKGDLKTEILFRALRQVVGNTETLCSVCREEDGEVVLQQQPADKLTIECYQAENFPVQGWDEFGQRPFCLTNDLPLRVLLVEYGPEDFRIEFVFHHICIDLVSMEDFWTGLSAGYENLATGRATVVRHPSVLKDYAVWENSYFSRNDMNEGLNYWQHEIDQIPPAMTFIRDRKKEQYRCLEFEIGIGLKQRVDRLAALLDTTPFRIYLSAWLWTLAGYTGSNRASVSCAVNVRPPELKGLVAPFVNNLPCGVELADNPSFAATIGECSRKRREARRYEYTSITDMIEQARRRGYLQPEQPFLNTAINYVAWGRSQKLELMNTCVVFERRVQTDSYFDLTLEIEPDGAGYCRMICGGGFTKKLISSMQRFWLRTLSEGCRNPEICFSGIPFLTSGEIRLHRWRSERSRNVADQKLTPFLTGFREIVGKYGNKIALSQGRKKITYRELDQWSDHIALAVRSEAGERPVGICLRRNCNYVAVVLGVMKAGTAYVPLDIAYPSDRLAFVVNDCDIRLVVTNWNLAGLTGCRSELYIEDLMSETAEAGNSLLPLPAMQDTAYIIYTSGTTGYPKGVPVSHENLSHLIRNAVHHFRLTSRSVQLQYATLAFDASVMEIFPSLSVGAVLCPVSELERKDPVRLASLIRRKKVTIAYIAPVMLAQMKPGLPLLKTLLVGGESTAAEVLRRWYRGRRLLNVYGPTETTVFVTVCEVKECPESDNVGRFIAGVSGYILDEYGRLLPDGVPGELCIGGKQLTSGYLNRQELNQEKFVTRIWGNDQVPLYRTGDRMLRYPDRHFHFLGRIDQQVKINGLRIELGEIEQCLNSSPGVRQALVVVKENGILKRLVAYVQLEKPGQADVMQWQKKLSGQLPAYMIPSAWVVLEEFPRTVNGKTDYRQLPEPEWQLHEYVAPCLVTEELLAGIAAQLLGIEKISVEEDLFLLGLSSLTAVVLSGEAGKAGISLPVSVVYRERTIRKMVADDQQAGCHWFSHRDKTWPVVVLVCGHMDFGAMLYSLADELKRWYSVLVIESFHDHGAHFSACPDFSALICSYEQLIVEKLSGGEEVYAFAGHCLGGEMAYALAVQWALHHVGRPEVWMFNSLAHRKMPEGWMQTKPLTSPLQNMLWEKSLKRKRVADDLISTMLIPGYTGRVVLFLPEMFTVHLAGPDLPDLADDEVIANLKTMYEANPGNWKALAPRLEIYRLPGDHWTMLRTETLKNVNFEE